MKQTKLEKEIHANVEMHSMRALTQWRPLWKENCAKNKPKIRTSQRDILGCYRDKSAILIAYGPSFEKNVNELLKSKMYRDKNVVIGCVDKAFSALVKMGVIPDYCIVADGTVSSDEWLEDVPDEAIKRCVLISNIYGAPGWSDRWASVAGCSRIYWYLNKDNVGSHNEFGALVDYYEVIPAASNVGNSLCVFSVQIFGIKNIYLLGYDYSWQIHGNYYGAVDSDKKYFMSGVRKPDINNNLVHTSSNMDFSARWLDRFFNYANYYYKTVFYNCTGAGILRSGHQKKLV